MRASLALRTLGPVVALTLGLAGAVAPASSAEVTFGTLAMTVVDDRGAVVPVGVELYDDLGERWLVEGLQSTGQGPVPARTYGIAVFGGWAGLTCLGLTPCSMRSMGGAREVRPTADAYLFADGVTTSVNVTLPTPRVTGTGVVGSPLTVWVPASLTALAESFGGVGSVDPGVAWLRNGVPIAGASGLTYVPGAADGGATISAVISYPTAIIPAGPLGPGLIPPPLTIATTVRALPPAPGSAPFIPPTPSVTPAIALAAPAKVVSGRRAKVRVTVAYGSSPVPGKVRLQVGKRKPVEATLTAGAAAFSLPKLKPGRYTLTATYLGDGLYAGVTTTKKLTVRTQKPRRR